MLAWPHSDQEQCQIHREIKTPTRIATTPRAPESATEKTQSTTGLTSKMGEKEVKLLRSHRNKHEVGFFVGEGKMTEHKTGGKHKRSRDEAGQAWRSSLGAKCNPRTLSVTVYSSKTHPQEDTSHVFLNVCRRPWKYSLSALKPSCARRHRHPLANALDTASLVQTSLLVVLASLQPGVSYHTMCELCFIGPPSLTCWSCGARKKNRNDNCLYCHSPPCMRAGAGAQTFIQTTPSIDLHAGAVNPQEILKNLD